MALPASGRELAALCAANGGAAVGAGGQLL